MFCSSAPSLLPAFLMCFSISHFMVLQLVGKRVEMLEMVEAEAETFSTAAHVSISSAKTV